MRYLCVALLIISLITVPVSALDITAPQVPDSAKDVMPDVPETFSEGLWQLLKAVLPKVQPELTEAARVCLSLVAIALMIFLLLPMAEKGKRIAGLVSAMCIGVTLLRPTRSLIALGIETVHEVTNYGKLLLPVMTSALAAQGGVTKSAALYAGASMFITLLGSLVSAFLIPLIYVFLALSVANSAVGEDTLKRMRDFVKWIATWVLKLGLYGFTGFIGITGVISGTTDATALKVTKMTISGAVPVVGGILSNASEAVLLSAGMVKNAAGIYGLLAILAVCLGPFLQIGVQYLLLKLTSAVCSVFASKEASGLIQDFSTAMGMLLATTGSVCLMLLISTVCFMKGVGG